ncbi:Ribonuclease [Globisporangium polare]
MARAGGFYAVAKGRGEGVFSTWVEAEALVKGYAGARFKRFSSRSDAEAYLSTNGSSAGSGGDNGVTTQPSTTSSYYAARQQQASRKHARSDERQSVAAFASRDSGVKRARLLLDDRKSPPSVYYAVAEGNNTGVVTSWPQVLSLTEGYDRPVYRKFETREAAEAYLSGCTLATKRRTGGCASAGAGAEAIVGSTTEEATADVKTVEAVERAALLPERYWYAVAKGRETGVFETWQEAKKQVEGLFGASFKKFPSREEAEASVRRYQQNTAASSTDGSDPDPQHPDTLVAFCDGSALQNGRRGCQAGFACVFPHNTTWNVATKLKEARATNNRAEYFAALEAMKRANLQNAAQDQVLYIFSDSMLLIRSMTEWVDNWRKKNWCKADGAPVMNRDILEKLIAEQGRRRILWRHVKAHTGRKDWKSVWNDAADQAARNAAECG